MHDVLNPLPALLDYRIFAPALLRVCAAGVFAWLAYTHYKNRDKIAAEKFPFIGSASWVAWLAAVIETAVALALLLGYYTQYAAIVGALVSLKQLVWSGRNPSFFVLSRGTAALLVVIALSLLLTGAGRPAFDLPL